MKNLIKLFLIAFLALNLNAEEQKQPGLSEQQMDEVRAIMRQTQELIAEQEAERKSKGESIFNNAEQQDINKHTKKNFQINPLGLYEQSPEQEIIDFGNAPQPPKPKSNIMTQSQTSSYDSGTSQISKEEMELMQNAIRNQNLHALQNKFFAKNRTGYENTQNINYTTDKTHKIRTRHAMATTLIFDSNIESYVLGDTSGYSVQELPNKPNAIVVKPHLIGIDTSLTIFTADGKLHTFYLFSTDYKNGQDPAIVVHIKDEETKTKQIAKQEKINKEYITIKDGIAEAKVKKSEIDRNYTQTATKENEWLYASEIFSDKKFTYFKYEKDKMPQIPTIYAVIDKQDSPVETRVIGDYIIAETINPKFSIKSGNSFVCVNREKPIENKKTSNTTTKTMNKKIITNTNERHKKIVDKMMGINNDE